jgi:DNA-binding CsgD family transcriptional regulator
MATKWFLPRWRSRYTSRAVNHRWLPQCNVSGAMAYVARQALIVFGVILNPTDACGLTLVTTTDICRRSSASRRTFGALAWRRPRANPLCPRQPQHGRRGPLQVGDDSAALSYGELQVLYRVALGETDASIARVLHVSEATVTSRMAYVMQHLGVYDRPHAVAVAQVLGILKSP